MPCDVTITRIPCPFFDAHKSDANVELRQRPDGSLFCPVHGDMDMDEDVNPSKERKEAMPACLYNNPPEKDCGARACAVHGTPSASPYGKRRGAVLPTWELLGVWGAFEYWHGPDGDVYRRKVSDWNVMGADGSPMGARWESSLAHFQRCVAGRLAV